MTSKKLVVSRHNIDEIKEVAMRYVYSTHYGLDGKLLLLQGLRTYMDERGYTEFEVQLNDIEIVYDSTDE